MPQRGHTSSMKPIPHGSSTARLRSLLLVLALVAIATPGRATAPSEDFDLWVQNVASGLVSPMDVRITRLDGATGICVIHAGGVEAFTVPDPTGGVPQEPISRQVVASGSGFGGLSAGDGSCTYYDSGADQIVNFDLDGLYLPVIVKDVPSDRSVSQTATVAQPSGARTVIYREDDAGVGTNVSTTESSPGSGVYTETVEIGPGLTSGPDDAFGAASNSYGVSVAYAETSPDFVVSTSLNGGVTWTALANEPGEGDGDASIAANPFTDAYNYVSAPSDGTEVHQQYISFGGTMAAPIPAEVLASGGAIGQYRSPAAGWNSFGEPVVAFGDGPSAITVLRDTGVGFGGTSMATPSTAGALALLSQGNATYAAYLSGGDLNLGTVRERSNHAWGGGVGSWGEPTNWVPPGPARNSPGFYAFVTIDLGKPTIDFSALVDTLLIGPGGIVDVTGGGLTVTTNAELNGGVAVDGGLFIANGANPGGALAGGNARFTLTNNAVARVNASVLDSSGWASVDDEIIDIIAVQAASSFESSASSWILGDDGDTGTSSYYAIRVQGGSVILLPDMRSFAPSDDPSDGVLVAADGSGGPVGIDLGSLENPNLLLGLGSTTFSSTNGADIVLPNLVTVTNMSAHATAGGGLYVAGSGFTKATFTNLRPNAAGLDPGITSEGNGSIVDASSIQVIDVHDETGDAEARRAVVGATAGGALYLNDVETIAGPQNRKDQLVVQRSGSGAFALDPMQIVSNGLGTTLFSVTGSTSLFFGRIEQLENALFHVDGSATVLVSSSGASKPLYTYTLDTYDPDASSTTDVVRATNGAYLYLPGAQHLDFGADDGSESRITTYTLRVVEGFLGAGDVGQITTPARPEDPVEVAVGPNAFVDLSSLHSYQGVGPLVFDVAGGIHLASYAPEPSLTTTLVVSGTVFVNDVVRVGPTTTLSLRDDPVVTPTLNLGGSYEVVGGDPAPADLANGVVRLAHTVFGQSGATTHSVEVSGEDVGTDPSGLPDSNFSIGRLELGDGVDPALVTLVDQQDNGRRNGGREALYLNGVKGGDGLAVNAGSNLDIDRFNVYAWDSGLGDYQWINSLFPGAATEIVFGDGTITRYFLIDRSWIGGVDGDWDDTLNWDPPGLPRNGPGGDVAIAITSGRPIVGSENLVSVISMTQGSALSIDSAGIVTVTTNANLDGFLAVDGGRFVAEGANASGPLDGGTGRFSATNGANVRIGGTTLDTTGLFPPSTSQVLVDVVDVSGSQTAVVLPELESWVASGVEQNPNASTFQFIRVGPGTSFTAENLRFVYLPEGSGDGVGFEAVGTNTIDLSSLENPNANLALGSFAFVASGASLGLPSLVAARNVSAYADGGGEISLLNTALVTLAYSSVAPTAAGRAPGLEADGSGSTVLAPFVHTIVVDDSAGAAGPGDVVLEAKNGGEMDLALERLFLAGGFGHRVVLAKSGPTSVLPTSAIQQIAASGLGTAVFSVSNGAFMSLPAVQTVENALFGVGSSSTMSVGSQGGYTWSVQSYRTDASSTQKVASVDGNGFLVFPGLQSFAFDVDDGFPSQQTVYLFDVVDGTLVAADAQSIETAAASDDGIVFEVGEQGFADLSGLGTYSGSGFVHYHVAGGVHLDRYGVGSTPVQLVISGTAYVNQGVVVQPTSEVSLRNTQTFTSTLKLGGDFELMVTDTLKADTANGIVQFVDTGGGSFGAPPPPTEHTLEVAGLDVGLAAEALLDDNFAIGQLEVGSDGSPATVQLVDDVDNGNRGGTGVEALYLVGIEGGSDGLRIHTGSSLDIGSINVYAYELSGDELVHLNALFPNGVDEIAYDQGTILRMPEPDAGHVAAVLALVLLRALHLRRRSA